MADIGYFLGGLAVGFAVSVPLIVLIMRGRIAKEHSEASFGTERLRAEAESLQARLKEVEEQGRQKIEEWGQERASLLTERSELLEARLQAEKAQVRAEEAVSGIQQRIDTVTSERDALVNTVGSLQSECQSLKISLATETSRADEADRVKGRALIEKQASCDQLVETERAASVRIRTDLTVSHEAVVKALRDQLASRETEHAKAISDLTEARNATEEALKRGYEKEIAAKQDLLLELQTYLTKADETLRNVFGDASTKALQKASESFFELAKKRFDERDETAKANADTHKKDIEKLLEPVKEELGELEKLNREIEKERAEAFGSLKETIQNLNKSNESLANALKKPSVRGSWGEGQLLSILESSGWVQGQNFDVQDVTEEDGKSLRTDVVVHLPRGRKIIIDSKAPLDQYMAAMEAETEEERTRRCVEHAKAVRGHVKALEKKEYWARYSESPPYVILFMPYEAAYQIACEHDRSLLDDAHRSRIIIANPMTLMNLVHLATFVLNEEKLQQNAEEVRQHGKQLCERLGKVLELMGDHGRHIRIAAESYNKMIASVGGRLIPAAGRMRDLGAGAEKSLGVPDSVDSAIRHLVVPEYPDHALVEGLPPHEHLTEAQQALLT